MSSIRFSGIALVLLTAACGSSGSSTSSGGGDASTSGGTSSGGTSSGGKNSGGTSTGGTSSGGTNSGGGGIGGSIGGSAGAPADAGTDTGSCLTGTALLAAVPPGGGSECSFTFTDSYTPDFINLVLTPGWGTVCYAGGSSGCGSGASSDGWWFLSPTEIALCDSTCSRFYDQPAGKLTLQFGCATEGCN